MTQRCGGGGNGSLSVFMTCGRASSEVGDGGGSGGSRSMRAACASGSIRTVGADGSDVVIRSALMSSHAKSATPSAKHEPMTPRKMAGDMSYRLGELGEHPPELEED